MRSAVAATIRALLDVHGPGAMVTLEQLADALAPHAATHEEIGAAVDALEAAGRTVDRADPGRASDALRRTIPAARALRQELGRAPTVDEIATRAGLTPGAVRQALALGRVLGR